MKMMRNLSFGTLGVITICLVAATIIEKIHGTETSASWIYVSPWMVAMWTLLTVSSAVYILRNRRRLSVMGALLHFAFVVILVGAAITHFSGERGKVTLYENGRGTDKVTAEDETVLRLPFTIGLKECGVEYYPGTTSPCDYYSVMETGGKISRVSMNNVLQFKGYRFYQTGLGEDYSVLSVSHDPWGTGVSYAGYILLVISMGGFFFQKRTRYRLLLKGLAISGLTTISTPAGAMDRTPLPSTLPEDVAAEFGRLYVYWNDRVTPMESMARDFTVKIYGSNTYRGLTPAQVLTGWLFYYDDWKREPMIKVKDPQVRGVLGVDDKYVRLTDFFDMNGYKLEKGLSNHLGDMGWLGADEKVNLISRICTGNGFKIIPVREKDETIWVSWVNTEGRQVDGDLEDAMEIVAREIAHGRYESATEKLRSVRNKQREVAGVANLPSESKFRSEIIYDKYGHTLPAAILALVVGVCSFIIFCREVTGRGGTIPDKYGVVVTRIAEVTLLVWITTLIALRWVIGGHVPVSNGYETMMAMAWMSLVISTAFGSKIRILGSGGLLVCGFALLVSTMGQNNPAVTNLMPVLQSPLLSVHVMIIMTGYALFAMMMIDSIASFVMGQGSEVAERMARISNILLYPALFLLAAGIFTGAVWANQSWGRYWGWDSKETWALVTMIIYALPLHGDSFPAFRKPVVLNYYFLFAFVSVLFTYFGVNYLLGGLHSYA